MPNCHCMKQRQKNDCWTWLFLPRACFSPLCCWCQCQGVSPWSPCWCGWWSSLLTQLLGPSQHLRFAGKMLPKYMNNLYILPGVWRIRVYWASYPRTCRKNIIQPWSVPPVLPTTHSCTGPPCTATNCSTSSNSSWEPPAILPNTACYMRSSSTSISSPLDPLGEA